MESPKFESLEDYLTNQPQEKYSPERHDKGWGYELWAVNNPLYCGKILVLLKDKKCSMHFHVGKDETFYIAKGEMLLELIYKNGSKKLLSMEQGDCFHVTPGLMHQFIGVADETHIIEFSTQHFESDSYRIAKGD